MKINEVEKLLGIPMATIRFYEKEGLLTPQRNKNSYREYSEADVQLIKKIIVFRKIGLSVEDIKHIFEGQLSLQDTLAKNILSLHEKMKALDGAINLTMEMQENERKNDYFDTEYYWDLIHKEEQGGSRFCEVINDVITFERQVFIDQFDLTDEEGNRKLSSIESIMVIGGLCALSGLLWSATDNMSAIRFLQGLLFPFVLIIIKSLFGLPIFIRKKNPIIAAKTIRKIWPVILTLFFVTAILIRVFILN